MDLVEEAEDLATGLLPLRLIVVHDAVGRGEHDVAELAGREQVGDPLVDVLERHIEARADDAALVDAARQLDHDFPGPVVVDDLELADVAVLLHRLQEFHDDLRARSDQHLALAALLGVRDGLEAVREDLW